jgi:hypothetical protein
VISKAEAIAAARQLAEHRGQKLGRTLGAKFVAPGFPVSGHWFVLIENKARRMRCTPYLVNGATGRVRGQKTPRWLALALEAYRDWAMHRAAIRYLRKLGHSTDELP